ncbi:sulfotransferase family protein [Psychroflexus sp. MBR-150]|jgi:hypothetical protein
MKKNIKALFIGGAGHSGTTMLSKIFASHHNSFSVNGESRICDSYSYISKEYNKLESDINKLKFLEDTAFYGVSFKKKLYQYEQKKNNPLKNILSHQKISGSFHRDYHLIIQRALTEKNLDFFVEKTPSNVFHAKEVFTLIPESKLLIIHRDVRDVVASLKKRYLTLLENPEVYKHNLDTKKLDKDYNLVIDALMWNRVVLNSYKALSKYGSEKVKIIRYEDFVNDAEAHTKSICDWLDIDFQPQMLDLKARNSADQNIKREKGVSNSSVANFSKTLNHEEIKVVEKYAKKGMQTLNIKPYQKSNIISKKKVFQYEIESYLKVLSRIKKRLTLMEPKYALNFSKRFLKKLFSK